MASKVGDIIYTMYDAKNPGMVVEVYDPPIKKLYPPIYQGIHPLEVEYHVKVEWLDGTVTDEKCHNLCNLFNLIEYHRAKAEKYQKIYNLIKSWGKPIGGR